MRRPGFASALLAILLSFPLAGLAAGASPASPAPTTDLERATAALRFLVAAQRPDGSLDASIGETADLVIGAADAGYDPATLRGCAGTGTSALAYLGPASDAATSDAGKTAKIILAVVAAGGDARAFDGRDLVARLGALYHASSGTYGDGSTFGQALAILALGAAHEQVPPQALTALRGLQDADGSWNFGKAANSTPGDTNSTAIALVALAAAGDQAADAKALAWLHSQQLADGGFPYQNSNAYGPPASDPDSDALVLQALVATGQDPEAAAWTTKAGDNLLTHLRSTQAADGGFIFPGSKGPNALTTSQVPAGLLRQPYGSTTSPTAGRAVAGVVCSATAAVGGVPATSTLPAGGTGRGGPGEAALVGLGLLLATLLGGGLLALRRRA